MKKYVLMVCMMLLSTATFAQLGPTYIGVNASYGLHKDYKNFGIGAKVQYEFIENWRAEASGDYFFKKDDCKMWDVNLNLHYLFKLNDSFAVYPLAGMTIVGMKEDFTDESDSKFGFNAGGGIEYALTEKFKVNFEAKYQYVKDFDRPVLSVGLSYAL